HGVAHYAVQCAAVGFEADVFAAGIGERGIEQRLLAAFDPKAQVREVQHLAPLDAGQQRLARHGQVAGVPVGVRYFDDLGFVHGRPGKRRVREAKAPTGYSRPKPASADLTCWSVGGWPAEPRLTTFGDQ